MSDVTRTSFSWEGTCFLQDPAHTQVPELRGREVEAGSADPQRHQFPGREVSSAAGVLRWQRLARKAKGRTSRSRALGLWVLYSDWIGPTKIHSRRRVTFTVHIIAFAESVRSANSGNGHNEKRRSPKERTEFQFRTSVLVYIFEITTPPAIPGFLI